MVNRKKIIHINQITFSIFDGISCLLTEKLKNETIPIITLFYIFIEYGLVPNIIQEKRFENSPDLMKVHMKIDFKQDYDEFFFFFFY